MPEDTVEVGAEAPAPQAETPAKDVVGAELLADLQAVAVKHKAQIYGNAVEQDSPKPFAFTCDGTK